MTSFVHTCLLIYFLLPVSSALYNKCTLRQVATSGALFSFLVTFEEHTHSPPHILRRKWALLLFQSFISLLKLDAPKRLVITVGDRGDYGALCQALWLVTYDERLTHTEPGQPKKELRTPSSPCLKFFPLLASPNPPPFLLPPLLPPHSNSKKMKWANRPLGATCEGLAFWPLGFIL